MSQAKPSIERLLEMIVCVGIADRLQAMSIRGARGDEAAIEYLRHCTISDENYGPTTWQPELRLVVNNAPDDAGGAA
jgi:hypothetical protein